MNENDLRVIKTRENIEKAFFQLLSEKPLDKITVVELAHAARIHKSTFYLHYLDIPDLYAKTLQKVLQGPVASADFFPYLFDDPDRFLAEMSKMVNDNLGRLNLVLQDQTRYVPMDALLELMRDKIYSLGRLEKTTENDIRLDTIFGSLLVCMPNYREHQDVVNKVAAPMIRCLLADMQ
ncbi:MAG: TetR/AcrR family transcriptional regulator [Lachnospiraceae bacterium]|nr:TetR/AcrR family transcriptional regulator [Lachnospiraceae bacterium]